MKRKERDLTAEAKCGNLIIQVLSEWLQKNLCMRYKETGHSNLEELECGERTRITKEEILGTLCSLFWLKNKMSEGKQWGQSLRQRYAFTPFRFLWSLIIFVYKKERRVNQGLKFQQIHPAGTDSTDCCLKRGGPFTQK